MSWLDRAREMVRGGEAADFQEACRILQRRAAKSRSANAARRRSQKAREARLAAIQKATLPSSCDV